MRPRVIVFVVCLFVLLSAGCKPKEYFRCRLTDGGVVLDKSYSISFFRFMDIKRQGTLSDYYRSKGGDAVDFLGTLNADLAADLEKCKERGVAKTEPDLRYEGEGKFAYTEGRPGRVASVNAVATRLIEGEGYFDGELPFLTLEPVLTVDDLKKHTEKIVSFSTDYASSSQERKHNIALATDKLDGLTVEAGDTLSFNQTVGERTKENGYKESVVIEYGQFTRGVGGGVCQVSTTLYNAWIGAGLDAVSNNHSLPVSYVPGGLDAMVSKESDLVLQNNTPYPVFLDADSDGKKVTFTLYGTPSKEEIVLSGEKIATYPCDEFEIIFGSEEKILSEPKDGYLYQSYRSYYKRGVLVKKEKLRTSSYKKVKGKKIVQNSTPAE